MRGAAFAAALLLAAPALAQEAAPIRLNQLGLDASGPKRAMLADPSAAPLDWVLEDAAGKPALRGKTKVYGADAASGEHVHSIELGGFTTPGKGYRLRVGAAASRPFAIGAGMRAGLAAGALAFFYHQRAGVPIEARYVGERRARPAGHAREIAPCFAGKDQRGLDWPGCDYRLDVTGGWYDAGDHGKYVVNGGIALWTLVNAYETGQRRGRPVFPDGSARIPEAGNGTSDLLDEASREMEFLLAMQIAEGVRTRVPVGPPVAVAGQPAWNAAPAAFAEIDAGGMAHQKVADRRWTKLPMPPQDDPEDRLLYPPTTAATLNLAATAAQCGRVWRGVDDGFAARCLAAAERAWAAARRNPQVYATNSFDGSGGYGDGDVSDEFFWAAAELYATTGKGEYLAALRTSPHWSGEVSEPGWPRTASLGTVTLATVRTGLPADEVARQRALLTAAADRFLAERARNGYHIPYAPAAYPWGSTSNLLNRAMLLGHAHDLTGDAKYRDGVIDALDYILGRNPLDRSYVAGFGARPMAHPHHRFWAPSLDPKLPPPPPGALSGGPNNSAMTDEVAKAMQGKCAPQTCWADDVRAYALNEVAINWNAPLFWVAAWLGE